MNIIQQQEIKKVYQLISSENDDSKMLGFNQAIVQNIHLNNNFLIDCLASENSALIAGATEYITSKSRIDNELCIFMLICEHSLAYKKAHAYFYANEHFFIDNKLFKIDKKYGCYQDLVEGYHWQYVDFEESIKASDWNNMSSGRATIAYRILFRIRGYLQIPKK